MDSKLFEQIMDDVRSQKYASVEKFLEKNHSKFSKDSEFYVILLNYSFQKGYRVENVIGKQNFKQGDFAIANVDTNETVGYIGENIVIDSKVVVDAITKTRKSIKYFNNRLDIHLGIAMLAAKIERWDIVKTQLIDILTTSKTISNKWTWGYVNSMNSGPKAFMLDNVQAMVYELFHVKTKDADEAMIAVSEKMIQEYPDAVYGYSNLGTLYLAQQKYTLAEKYLLEAEKIDPKDKIVQGNLKLLRDASAQKK